MKTRLSMELHLDYTPRIKPKRVTSGGVHHLGQVLVSTCSEKISKQWRVVGQIASNLTNPGSVFRNGSTQKDRARSK